LANILIIIVSGITVANTEFWGIEKDDIPEDVSSSDDAKGGGEGGFMPFGFAGVMTGAATCFYGFVGFDTIATTGEETRNPKRTIPLAMVCSLTIIFLAYFSVSIVITMIQPYYDLNEKAPFFYGFAEHGESYKVVKWIVSMGALFALSTSLLGAMVRMLEGSLRF
jgi:amino acid transporter